MLYCKEISGKGTSLWRSNGYLPGFIRGTTETIFVVRVLKDIDTGESIVVCKDASFSKEDNEHYYLIRYTSFCEQVEVDGVLRDKYVRQTRCEIDEGTVREMYEDGFPEPKSKPFTYVDDEYAECAIRCSRTYYEYAKAIITMESCIFFRKRKI